MGMFNNDADEGESTSLLPPGQSWAMERMPTDADFVDYVPVDAKETPGAELEERICAPKIWLLVLINIIMSALYMIHVLGAWLFVAFNQNRIFPACLELYPQKEGDMFNLSMAITCNVSVGIFWSWPLLLSLVALMLFSRDVLLMYIYYEMLRYRVHVAFEVANFFKALAVWITLGWGILGLTVYYFAHHLGIKAFLFTLPYWIPIISFISLLFGSWVLQNRLVSVSNFVSKDVDWAKDEFEKTCLLKDFGAQVAWHDVVADIDAGQEGMTFDTEEFIHFLVDKSQDMAGHEGSVNYSELPDKVGGAKVMNPDYFGSLGWHGFDDRNWMKQMIVHPSMECPRNNIFKMWYGIFRVYRFIMTIIIIFCLISTGVSVYVNQGWPVPEPLKVPFEWLTIKSFAVVKKLTEAAR
eukprot:gnl/TRDRNA2_/TRDRNA2_182195_c0_seq1.p1 gnl/TRDRNA2_/TRDRNA2_182195_c0~~gnl/TRDRNA2_/TRDRNA2_182195_c0_seq1.p1  ORF type:complete len:410 (-),score=79.02 gnl/TRDRNA2_/TRDRNA2_182195_c0_seq1:65-1294(-)